VAAQHGLAIGGKCAIDEFGELWNSRSSQDEE
jgi:hypothetical protein